MKTLAIVFGSIVAFELAVLTYVETVRAFDLRPPPSARLQSKCYATNDGVTCTFSNDGVSGRAGSACAYGKLEDKTKGSLDSIAVCSGRLEPKDTTTRSGPWTKGQARDICFTETSIGKQLDWSNCSFDTTEL